MTDFRIVTLAALSKNVLALSMDGPGDHTSKEITFLALRGLYCPVKGQRCEIVFDHFR